MSRPRRRIGALATGCAAVFAPVACGGSGEGTVVAKANMGTYDYSCQAGGDVAGPMAVPVWGACSVPDCWRLVVRDSAGNTTEPCVSRDEYDQTPLGTFWHDPTDRPTDS